jgi:uncharacterized protein (DUF4415 family)
MNRRYESRAVPSDAEAAEEGIDFTDIPELGPEFWKSARLVYPERRKKQVTLRIDPDVLEWFQSQGAGYQTRMNAVLRRYYEAVRDDR